MVQRLPGAPTRICVVACCSISAAVIIVVLQRFAVDLLIVSDLVYLDDALKGEDDIPRKEGTLEMVRRAVWGIL